MGCCGSPMRIVSLVPHATELLFALGLGDDVVAVTHEGDFPEAVLSLRHVTRAVLPAGRTPPEMDEAISEPAPERLRERQPDLIVPQELCPVCAVSYDDVREVASTIPTQPRV